MKNHDARETHGEQIAAAALAALANQIQSRREGGRRNVRHGGALCCRCLDKPPRKGAGKAGGYCDECHAIAQKDFRARQREKARKRASAQVANNDIDNRTGQDNGQDERSGDRAG